MWNRRELLGVLGTGAAGLALLTNRSEAGEEQIAPAADDHHGHNSQHSAMMKECAEACGHCEAACNEAFHHCVAQAGAGKAEHARMAQITIDCAAFCNLSATLMTRHSPLMIEACRACAEASHRCAEHCSSSASDEVMKNCVEACKKCEESCRKMIAAMGGGEHQHQNPAIQGRGRQG